MYEKSFMHREVVSHVAVAAHDFIITASADGDLRFWKLVPVRSIVSVPMVLLPAHCGMQRFISAAARLVGGLSVRQKVQISQRPSQRTGNISLR